LNITATDEAGNTGYLEALFLVDPELPVIQSAGFNNLYTDNVVEIAVNATDNYSIDSVRALVFGKTVNLNLSLDGLYHGSVLAPSAEGTYPQMSLSVMSQEPELKNIQPHYPYRTRP